MKLSKILSGSSYANPYHRSFFFIRKSSSSFGTSIISFDLTFSSVVSSDFQVREMVSV
ncbi:hypothetical protein IKO18_02340 [bacterium]|nr:hypothetical protein [bacterium]